MKPFSEIAGILKRKGYSVVRELGEGGQYITFLATHNRSGACAVRILNRWVEEDPEALPRAVREELDMAKELRSSMFFTTLIDWFIEEGRLITVWDYAVGGTLRELVDPERGLDRKTCLELLLPVARGLDSLCVRNCVHGDIKPDNLFVYEDNVVKIGDLGIARFLDSETIRLTIAADLRYILPKHYETPTRERDIFGFAVTYAELRLGRHPYEQSGTSIFLSLLENKPQLEGIEEDEQKLVLPLLKNEVKDLPDKLVNWIASLHDLKQPGLNNQNLSLNSAPTRSPNSTLAAQLEVQPSSPTFTDHHGFWLIQKIVPDVNLEDLDGREQSKSPEFEIKILRGLDGFSRLSDEVSGEFRQRFPELSAELSTEASLTGCATFSDMLTRNFQRFERQWKSRLTKTVLDRYEQEKLATHALENQKTDSDTTVVDKTVSSQSLPLHAASPGSDPQRKLMTLIAGLLLGSSAPPFYYGFQRLASSENNSHLLIVVLVGILVIQPYFHRRLREGALRIWQVFSLLAVAHSVVAIVYGSFPRWWHYSNNIMCFFTGCHLFLLSVSTLLCSFAISGRPSVGRTLPMFLPWAIYPLLFAIPTLVNQTWERHSGKQLRTRFPAVVDGQASGGRLDLFVGGLSGRNSEFVFAGPHAFYARDLRLDYSLPARGTRLLPGDDVTDSWTIWDQNAEVRASVEESFEELSDSVDEIAGDEYRRLRNVAIEFSFLNHVSSSEGVQFQTLETTSIPRELTIGELTRNPQSRTVSVINSSPRAGVLDCQNGVRLFYRDRIILLERMFFHGDKQEVRAMPLVVGPNSPQVGGSAGLHLWGDRVWFVDDGKRLVIPGYDNELGSSVLCVFDAETGELQKAEYFESAVEGTYFESVNSSTLRDVSRNGQFYVTTDEPRWKGKPSFVTVHSFGKSEPRWSKQLRIVASAVAVSDDGGLIAVGDKEGNLVVWNLREDKRVLDEPAGYMIYGAAIQQLKFGYSEMQKRDLLVVVQGLEVNGRAGSISVWDLPPYRDQEPTVDQGP